MDLVIVPDVSVGDVQQALHDCGFGVRTGPVDGIAGDMTLTGVHDFQEAWFSDPVEVDGVVGPKTWSALQRCRDGGGRLSPHFLVSEFQDTRTGEVRVRRALVDALETYRGLDGGAVLVVSGYRSAATNRAVGGATLSAHLYGLAVDVPPLHSTDTVMGLALFSGIGYEGDTGLVRHLDVRHEAYPWEQVGDGDPGSPALWAY
jgi:Peptidase M15/Putative peptidoglycan binding domain